MPFSAGHPGACLRRTACRLRLAKHRCPFCKIQQHLLRRGIEIWRRSKRLQVRRELSRIELLSSDQANHQAAKNLLDLVKGMDVAHVGVLYGFRRLDGSDD